MFRSRRFRSDGGRCQVSAFILPVNQVCLLPPLLLLPNRTRAGPGQAPGIGAPSERRRPDNPSVGNHECGPLHAYLHGWPPMITAPPRNSIGLLRDAETGGGAS